MSDGPNRVETASNGTVYVEDLPKRIFGNLLIDGPDGRCAYIYAGISERCLNDAVAHSYTASGKIVEMCAEHAREDVPEPPSSEQAKLVTDGSADPNAGTPRGGLFTSEDRATFRRAVETWGIDAQADMAEEEAAEFIAASKHHRRDKASVEDLIDELADLRIMCEQLSLYIGRDIVEARVREKMKRLRERLDDRGESA